MKKKKLCKKLWKVYKTSQDYRELSLDQQNRDWTSIEDISFRIILKETKKFRVEGEGDKAKISLI